uniref:Uncharacterized protein n=1 Tax=Arundo donax TaxID=35708 RepID=A0A0A9BL60_ARUDO
MSKEGYNHRVPTKIGANLREHTCLFTTDLTVLSTFNGLGVNTCFNPKKWG